MFSNLKYSHEIIKNHKPFNHNNETVKKLKLNWFKKAKKSVKLIESAWIRYFDSIIMKNKVYTYSMIYKINLGYFEYKNNRDTAIILIQY